MFIIVLGGYDLADPLPVHSPAMLNRFINAVSIARNDTSHVLTDSPDWDGSHYATDTLDKNNGNINLDKNNGNINLDKNNGNSNLDKNNGNIRV